MRDARLSLRTLVRLGALLCLLFCIGCSARKLAYGLADRFILKATDDVFHLTGAQKQRLRANVQALLRWHKHDELPRYAAVLARLERDLADGLSREELSALLADASTAGERLARVGAPVASSLLVTLSDAQIDHAAKKMQEEERERFRDLGQSDAEYLERRLRTARKSLRTWLGEPTAQQEQLVIGFLSEARGEEQRRRARAERNRLAFVALLRAHPSVPTLTPLLEGWMTRQEFGAPREPAADAAARRRFVEMVLQLDATLTPAQRRHLINELEGWRRDLTELAQGAVVAQNP